MPKILKAFRSELDPTVEQRKVLARTTGCARFSYNWALAEWKRQRSVQHRLSGGKSYKQVSRRARRLLVYLMRGKPLAVIRPVWLVLRAKLRGPSWQSLHVQLVALKSTDYPWLYEVSAYAIREAIHDLGDAYKHFFRRLKEGKRGKAAGSPKFRARRKPSGRGWHCMQPTALVATDRTVKLPGVGAVKLKRHGYIPTSDLRGLAVRERAGRWFVAVQVQVTISPKARVEDRRISAEVGIRHLAVTSSGHDYGRITTLESAVVAKRKVRLWSRRMDRRYQKGKPQREQSCGWHEAVRQVAKYHGRGSDCRRDAVHQATTRIVRERAAEVVIRDNDVSDMLGRAGKKGAARQKRNRLAPIINFGNMYEFRRQIEYKQKWAGGITTIVPNDFPSTKMCSMCGDVRPDDPGYPDFRCPVCGHHEDREKNSARNLLQFDPGNGTKTSGGRSGGNPPQGGTMAGGIGSGDTNGQPFGAPPNGDATSPFSPGNRAGAQASGKGTGPIGSSMKDASITEPLFERPGGAENVAQENHTVTTDGASGNGTARKSVHTVRKSHANFTKRSKPVEVA